MRRIIFACALAGILALANALDGTSSPNVPPLVGVPAAPPDLQLCGYPSC